MLVISYQYNTINFYYFAPTIIKKTITSVGEDVGKLEHSYMADGNVKYYSHFSKNSLTVP